MKFNRMNMHCRLAFVLAAVPVCGLTPAAIAEEHQEVNPDAPLDVVVVEGVPLGRTVEQLAQPTTVLDADELMKRQAASIGETLAHELGVSSTYFGPVASRPVIRGQSGERIRILANALDTMDASALSEDHAASAQSMLAERIEIIRGPATLLYGSGAAGGLVNVVDNRIQSDGLQAPFGGRITLGTDAATGKRSGSGEIAFGKGAMGFHLDYFRLDTDDVEIPGFAESARQRAMEQASEPGDAEEEAFGVVPNTASEAQGGAAAVTLTGAKGYLGLSVSGYENLYGVPGHHHEEEAGGSAPDEEEELVRIDLDQTRVDVEGEYRFAEAGELRLKLARSDYEHVELEGSEIGTLFGSEGTDVRLEYRHRPFGDVEGAVGLQHKLIDFTAVGDEAYVPGSDTRQTSLFLFEEWQPTDRWVLQGSARIEEQTIDVDGQPTYDDTAFGASLGVIRSLGDAFSVAVNVALTERHPNATELYADGAHVAVQRFELGSISLGNGILDKEVSSNIDLTFRGESRRVEWTVTAFLNDIEDYILLAPTALTQDGLQVFEYRQTNAQLYGFEAEARIELLDSDAGHLHTRVFTDYVHGEDDNTGEYLPRITPLRYGVGLHYMRDRFAAIVEAMFTADQDKFASNELPSDSYMLLSAELTYTFDRPDVFVFLRGTNLTDDEARQHTSPLKELVPLPARSLQLGLRYSF